MSTLPSIICAPIDDIILVSSLTDGVYGKIDEVVYRGEYYVRKYMHNSTYAILNEVYIRSTYIHPYMIETDYIFIDIINGELECSVLTKKYDDINNFTGDKFKLISQLLIVLAFLESKGVIHGDVKVDNILYSEEDDNIKLIDFGIMHNINDYTNIPTQTIVPIEYLLERHSQYAEQYPDMVLTNVYRRQSSYSMYATGITILAMLGVCSDIYPEAHYMIKTGGREWLKERLSSCGQIRYYPMISHLIYDSDKYTFGQILTEESIASGVAIGYSRDFTLESKHSKCSLMECELIRSQLSLSKTVIRRALVLYSSFSEFHNNRKYLITSIILSVDNPMYIDHVIKICEKKKFCTRSDIIKTIFNMMIDSAYTLPRLIGKMSF